MRLNPVYLRWLSFVLICILLLVLFTQKRNRANTVWSHESFEQGSRVHTDRCKWPPDNIEDIHNSGGGFNLNICVLLSADAPHNQSVIRYPMKSLFWLRQTDLQLSFDDLARLPRRFFGRVRYPEIYRTYPQDVPLRRIVRAIKAGTRVSHLPQYDFPIQVLATSKTVCHNGSRHDLVVVVKSSVLHWRVRQSFRNFMRLNEASCPGLRVGHIFSVGVPRKHGGRHFNRDGHSVSLKGPSGDELEAFDGKSEEAMARIKEEIALYDDILLANYEDTYYNLSLKSITNYRWMSAFCGAQNVKLFLIIDDDHRVNLSLVDAFMRRVPEATRRYAMFGHVASRDKAQRSPLKKLYLSYREYPWDRMCPYLRGFAQLVGPGVVDDMAIGTAYTRHTNSLEDVYLGMVAYRLGIRLVNEASMYDPELYGGWKRSRAPPMVAPVEHFAQVIP